MKIKTWIKYEEGYIPPRCRKTRYRVCEEYYDANIREVAPEEMQLAFEDNSYNGKGKIYFFKGKLWSKVKSGTFVYDPEEKGITSTLDELKWKSEHSSVFFPREWRDGEHPDRKRMIQAVKDANKNYIIIDGEVYSQTAEPRYDITTFGLGHNHGGTGLFVTYHYNPNISKDRYFSALQGDEAVAYANLIAARRGDTNDVGKFEKMIEVYMPELVKVKPNKHHGDGNKLMNDLESLIQGSSSAAEAGLLCMAFAAAH